MELAFQHQDTSKLDTSYVLTVHHMLQKVYDLDLKKLRIDRLFTQDNDRLKK